MKHVKREDFHILTQVSPTSPNEDYRAYHLWNVAIESGR